MNIKEMLSVRVVIFWLVLVAVIVVGCTPSGGPISVTRGVPIETTAVPTAVTTAVTGWCEGGPKVVTAEDVGCYLENADQEQVYRIDEETAVLYADPQSIDDWVEAAVIYHSPSNSMLVFDTFGDVVPQKSVFNSRAGLAVFEELSLDVELMATVKSEVQERWQTTSSNQPEIRLSTAWQAGRTAIFLVAIAGLETNDGRFYCPSQTWTMGEVTVQIEPLCITYVPGTPVTQFFFQSHEIEPDAGLTVKVELNGLESNEVQVGNGEVSAETAPTPEMAFDGQSNGCGDIFLYVSDSEHSEYLTVWVNAREIDLSSGSETLDLAAYPEDIEVKIDVYAGSVETIGEFPYCNDIAPMAEPESVWRAVSGFVTVTSTADGLIEDYCQQAYRAGALLEDVVFTLDGETIHLPSLSIDEVNVGWCAG